MNSTNERPSWVILLLMGCFILFVAMIIMSPKLYHRYFLYKVESINSSSKIEELVHASLLESLNTNLSALRYRAYLNLKCCEDEAWLTIQCKDCDRVIIKWVRDDGTEELPAQSPHGPHCKNKPISDEDVVDFFLKASDDLDSKDIGKNLGGELYEATKRLELYEYHLEKFQQKPCLERFWKFF